MTPSSGNVFADLGLPDAEELLAKADLVHVIQQLVCAKKLSRRAAAAVLDVAQPDLSKLFRGRLEGFSIERLVRMLNAFDQDVRVVVRPKAASASRRTPEKPQTTRISAMPVDPRRSRCGAEAKPAPHLDDVRRC